MPKRKPLTEPFSFKQIDAGCYERAKQEYLAEMGNLDNFRYAPDERDRKRHRFALLQVLEAMRKA